MSSSFKGSRHSAPGGKNRIAIGPPSRQDIVPQEHDYSSVLSSLALGDIGGVSTGRMNFSNTRWCVCPEEVLHRKRTVTTIVLKYGVASAYSFGFTSAVTGGRPPRAFPRMRVQVSARSSKAAPSIFFVGIGRSYAVERFEVFEGETRLRGHGVRRS